jgi:hypothetical protein
MIFGRGGEDWIALATKAAVEFSLGKQGAQFGFAARRKERQTIKRAQASVLCSMNSAPPWQNHPDSCTRESL